MKMKNILPAVFVGIIASLLSSCASSSYDEDNYNEGGAYTSSIEHDVDDISSWGGSAVDYTLGGVLGGVSGNYYGYGNRYYGGYGYGHARRSGYGHGYGGGYRGTARRTARRTGRRVSRRR